MESELLRIAEGFSIVAEGLCGLAKAEGRSKAVEKAQKALHYVLHFFLRLLRHQSTDALQRGGLLLLWFWLCLFCNSCCKSICRIE